MAGCKASRGISNACGDQLFAGGVDSDFYVGYISDLSTRFSLTQAADISSLAFTAYNGLVKFQGNKFIHEGKWPFIKGAGGNGFYQQEFSAKLIALSTQDDVEMQRLQQATDAFVIVKNNNGSFLIFGAGNGLISMPSPGGNTTGVQAADDVSDNVLLQGAEKTKPLRFFVTDEVTTVAYLNARVI